MDTTDAPHGMGMDITDTLPGGGGGAWIQLMLFTGWTVMDTTDAFQVVDMGMTDALQGGGQVYN